MKAIQAISAMVLLSVSALTAAASFNVVDSPDGRATFGATDVIDWGSLGPNFTHVASPFSISSASGVSATVSNPSASFERRNLNTGWGGNFTDGSTLLWTGGSITGAVDVAFGSLVNGFGFQINPDYSDTTTTVDIFGTGDTLLGAYTLTTNDRSQPSADFIGFTSDAANIARFSVSQSGRNDFAINQISLIKLGETNVPEPAPLALLGLGLVGFIAARRKSAK